MGPVPPRLVAVITCVAALGVVGTAGEALAAKKPTVRSSLGTLVTQVNALPDASAPAGRRRALKRLATHARRVARRRPCAAVRDLARLRRILADIPVDKRNRRRRRAGQRLSALGPTSLTASRLLLSSKRTRRCGGGVKAVGGDDPKVRILAANGRRLRVRVQLPELQFAAREAGGQAWTELGLPNSDTPGAPGTPGVPVVSDFLAVPDGAKIQVKTNDVDRVVLDGVDVFPVQPDPVDQVSEPPNFFAPPFSDRPFELNEKAYDRDALFPRKPADADALGRVRDLNLGALQIPAAQYNPASKKLVILKSVDVTLNFVGGPHTFSEQLSNPWEQPQRRLVGALLNARALPFRPDILYPITCGEEMIVITNPATVADANTFATARNAAGIRTEVFQTGANPGQIGTTAAQIQSFIRSELNSFFCIRPSYVTILGDDELVPTFPGINGIESDLQYSMANDADELPDLAVGRITGNDQPAVANAIAKILSYETSPPGGPWLRHATVAAQFQDDNGDGTENRTFTRFAEVLRDGVDSIIGVSVDRIYDDSPTATPLKFDTGDDLPAELLKPTFAWDGDGADVSAAWNEGRFLMVHRDHGWDDGWSHPSFTTANVQALTNGSLLPVLLSINCSSGAFQDDDTSFVGEALVKPNGGVVGAFGDTEDSPSWHNTQIAWGFADALLPSILPSEGPANRIRVGDALVHGKLRLAGLAPPSGPGIVGGDGSTRNELYLWHYFGDPSMQMWGGQPLRILNPAIFEAFFVEQVGPPPPDPPPYWVVVTLPAEFNGQTFSILRNGEVIGKGIANEGKANIPATLADGSDSPGQLQVAFDGDGSPPIVIDVKDEPPARETSITQRCSGGSGISDPIVVEGTLSGAPAGSLVTVTYQHAQGRTETVQDTTDAQGNFSTSLVLEQAGDWTMTARYAGTDEHAPSQGEPCVINSG